MILVHWTQFVMERTPGGGNEIILNYSQDSKEREVWDPFQVDQEPGTPQSLSPPSDDDSPSFPSAQGGYDEQ